MDKRSHWSSRLLETQKKIDTLFEKSRKTYSNPKARGELKIINEVIEEKLGEGFLPKTGDVFLGMTG